MNTLLLTAMLCPTGFAWSDAARRAEQHYRRGVEFFGQREPGKAAVELELSLKADPDQPAALKLLGLSYQLNEERNKAEGAFVQVTELAPRDSEGWFFLGRLYYDQNFFGKARRALDTAAKLTRGDHRISTYLGLTLEAVGETDEALQAYREAIRWNQKQPNPSFRPHYAYGVLLSKLDRLEEGRKQLTRARQLNPAIWETRFELAKAHYKLGDFGSALQELQDALKMSPPTEDVAGGVYYLMARIYFKLGRNQEGQDALAMREKAGR